LRYGDVEEHGIRQVLLDAQQGFLTVAYNTYLYPRLVKNSPMVARKSPSSSTKRRENPSGPDILIVFSAGRDPEGCLRVRSVGYIGCREPDKGEIVVE
jgi:hypothetical protein